MAAASSHRELFAGDVLDGRFLLVMRLGRGGFGDVWRAEELLPDGTPLRPIALKLLHKTAYDAADWAEEAKLLASFRHPSLVTIFAAGILGAERLPFVAMELLEGSTLADILRARRRIPWRRVLAWARATAAALDVIHARGVVHLDLKPSNLFLSQDGALKVLDFGISRRQGGKAPEVRVTAPLDMEAGLETAAFVAAREEVMGAATRGSTTSKAVVGTPGYMAPEILEMGEPTPAADAYALAATVVKLCTGRLPHDEVSEEPPEGTDPSVMSAWWSDVRDATLRGKVRDLAADPARLPRGLCALLARLLAVDPLQRGIVPGRLAALFDEVWERPHGLPDPLYPGAAPLGSEAEGMLFGRDDDVARLGRELAFEPCVMVHGPRGAGKTSLARAALVPHLGRSGADGKDDWIAVHVRPGDDPDHALVEALARVDPALGEAAPDALAAFAARSPVGLALLVDPLDEAATAPPARRERLFALLSIFAEKEPRSGLRAIGVMGEGHVPALFGADAPLAALRATLRFVGPPPAAAVDEIVTGPARLAGIPITGAQAVIAEVQRELRGEDNRLPLVALALRALWEARRGAELSGAAWREMGGVAGALAAHAERTLAALPDAELGIAIEALLRLSSTVGAPVRWDEQELVSVVGDDRRLVQRVLDGLVRANLLRRRPDFITLAHPSLASLKRIERVRSEQLDRLVLLERLREAAQAWDRAGMPDDQLLSGELLEQTRQHRAVLARRLTRLEGLFVEESMRRERRRKLGRAGALVALGLVIALGLFGKRAYDEQRARDAAARREAEAHAYLSDVLARARRADDPYQRAAWMAEAVEKGASDPALPLDLLRTAAELPHAHFLALEPASSPVFPWNARWLVAGGPGTTLLLGDMDPFDPSATGEEDSAPPPPPKAGELPDPRTTVIHPHAGLFVERVALPFDTGVATRAGSGEVRVWRLRPDGTVVLAAIAPMRCTGPLKVADAAPVLVCNSETGVARWDLRHAGDVDTHPFEGAVLDVSPDGAHVAAGAGTKVIVWTPAEKRTAEITAQRPVMLARFGPRERLLALVETSAFEVVDPARPGSPLFSGKSVSVPSFVRWDEGGLDLAVCGSDYGREEEIEGRFHYLRPGGRAPGDTLPRGEPCEDPQGKRPAMIRAPGQVADLARLALGPRVFVGGFSMEGGRVLSRDLVLFTGVTPAAGSLVRFRAPADEDPVEERASRSVSAAVRESEGVVAFQVKDEIRFYRLADSKRELSRKGNLLRRCADGRLAAWSREGDAWRVFEARGGAVIGSLQREPGLVLGIDAACRTLYTQRLDGAIVATGLSDGSASARVIAVADGYVYDVRPSAARGTTGPGLWIAVSSGAMARIDEATSTVRLYGYASPRAAALGDGPRAGELVYADDTGVLLLGAGGARRRLLEATFGMLWEDVSVARDGASMLLASAEQIAALDLGRGEVVGSLPLRGRTRFAPWDDEGSVLVYAVDRMGGAEAEIVPRGKQLSLRVARSLSNLRVEGGRIALLR